jgi:hypothetical protein
LEFLLWRGFDLFPSPRPLAATGRSPRAKDTLDRYSHDAQGTVIDTAVSRMPERPGLPWTEVWTVLHCDKRQPITMTFAPSPAGGVTWSIGGTASTPNAAAAEGCAAHRGHFPALIGKREPEVRTALVKMGGITTIRSGAPGMPATRDWRPDRATLVVENGNVMAIACG